ncbi:hypothetical protein AAG906_016173 [Vitis piasezkii]
MEAGNLKMEANCMSAKLRDTIFSCEMDFLELPTLGKLLDSKETSISYLLRVYLVVDMQQRTCTSVTWQMFVLPCAHVCAIICTMRHDVYEYIDPCFHVSTQQLIYSGQFQSLPTHNMPKVCEDGSLQDRVGNLFPVLQPPYVRHPPERPQQRCIETQFSHKRAIHCS